MVHLFTVRWFFEIVQLGYAEEEESRTLRYLDGKFTECTATFAGLAIDLICKQSGESS